MNIMNDAKYISLTHRIAEETQLLNEEKWILDALSKIRNQRNCLQIERLQLESMRNKLRQELSQKNPTTKVTVPTSPKPQTTFSLSMMQNTSAPKPPINSTPNRKLLEAEALCNKEKLNLCVNNPIFSSNPSEHFIIEEEEDEEEVDCDDLMLDMNMFMNCSQQQQQ